jgi:hypothetical protein
MSPDRVERIHVLIEDAEVLGELSKPDQRPTPAAARTIIVPILRRWIHDGLFYEAQRELLPHEVQFELFEEPVAIANCEKGILSQWMALTQLGGIGIGSSQIAPAWLSRLDQVPRDNGNSAKRKGSSFFEQKVFFWEGQFYKRAAVLGMHANKLGGVHLDPRRANDEGHIDALRQYFGVEFIGSNAQMLVGPDVTKAKQDVDRRGRTYDAMELIAIDTARIFSAGITESSPQLRALLPK